MYSQGDLQQTGKQLKRIIILLGAVLIAFLVISIILANTVSNTVGMIILLVGICLDIFIWGVYGSQILAYYRFLSDMFTGRQRVETGVVKRVGSQPVYKDNKLYYYEVLIDNDGVEQMLLIDANKPLPSLQVGQKYEFKVFQNFVIDVLSGPDI
ncbi:hypothetical protein JOD02_000449 [Caldicoprobacter guelmensis]|uniref:hypothetical protein n=1 Tax=Caldicoprobacter guelmensis TaxID=1170224 RepID=UPI001956254B|nr:hypothetical protein [Caldicoprobacter guelmensis]MBM7581626.1 hypothetical protein [Caldicoprobacter guelmensis]